MHFYFLGPPVFVKDNTRIQYGEKGKHMDLKVNVYSISNITCQYISTDHVENISLDTNVNRITTTDQLHGKPFKIMAWQVVFRFTTLASEQLKKYTVTVCNENGHSKYAISLQFRGKRFKCQDIFQDDYINLIKTTIC